MPFSLILFPAIAVIAAPPLIGLLLTTPRGSRQKASLYALMFMLAMTGLTGHFLEEVFMLDAPTCAAFTIPVSQLLSTAVAGHAVFLPLKKRLLAALISLCCFIISSLIIYTVALCFSSPFLGEL